MSDNSTLVDLLSSHNAALDAAARAKESATDARAQAETDLAGLVTACATSGHEQLKIMAEGIIECGRQIDELTDDPDSGLLARKVELKNAEVAFFEAAEKGDARAALATLRDARAEVKEKASEIRDLNRARAGQVKSLLAAVATLY